jgi:hypothetical protein
MNISKVNMKLKMISKGLSNKRALNWKEIYTNPWVYGVIAIASIVYNYQLIFLAALLNICICLTEKKIYWTKSLAYFFAPLSAAIIMLNGKSANAQFFNKMKALAVKFTGSSGGTQSTTFIDTTILFFQLMLAIYVVVGIIQTFNAMRNGDEWKETAKLPFFVLLGGVLADISVGVIAGV